MKKNKGVIIGLLIAALLVTLRIYNTAQIKTSVASGSGEIRPFQVHIPQDKLDDLKKRVVATKWPDRELVNDASQGVQLATMQKLASYWANNYDWRKVEEKLNSLPQFTTTIDGVDIHFIHVRSKHKNALPVIITHGWPGSVIEQLKIIGPLTDPTAYGGKAEDAFDVVIPSLPGYGFSGKPTTTGWNPPKVAQAWITLMQRLGYTKYVAQGGDWGNAVSEIMCLMKPAGLIGMHTNMPAAVPADISKALSAGKMPDGLAPDEQRAFQQLGYFYKKGLGYSVEMGNKPQTLYGIGDSPIGLAGWMLDHDNKSYELIARVFDGKTEGLTRDDILDNITLYWLTNTGVSSGRLYWETFQMPGPGGFFDPRNVPLPVAVTAFPDEIYTCPKSWAQKSYSKLIYFNTASKGGHFAAWEQPEILTSELREGFRFLRGSDVARAK